MSTIGEQALNDRMTALEVAFASLSATVTTKLDALIAATSAANTDHEARLRVQEAKPAPDPTHEQRIAKLEKAWWMVAGAALVVGGSAGGIVSAIWG
jgi:hypothetical protein